MADHAQKKKRRGGASDNTPTKVTNVTGGDFQSRDGEFRRNEQEQQAERVGLEGEEERSSNSSGEDVRETERNGLLCNRVVSDDQRRTSKREAGC